nr:vegetative cell wall protein gp1-like [Aegilops tauschii subsp. strangulata]
MSARTRAAAPSLSHAATWHSPPPLPSGPPGPQLARPARAPTPLPERALASRRPYPRVPAVASPPAPCITVASLAPPPVSRRRAPGPCRRAPPASPCLLPSVPDPAEPPPLRASPETAPRPVPSFPGGLPELRPPFYSGEPAPPRTSRARSDRTPR